MNNLPRPVAALLTFFVVDFAISLLLHKRILEQMKALHFELWVSLGSPKPIEAMVRNLSPGPRQASGAMSYTGWLESKLYRDIDDPELAARVRRLKQVRLVTFVMGLVLFLITIAPRKWH